MVDGTSAGSTRSTRVSHFLWLPGKGSGPRYRNATSQREKPPFCGMKPRCALLALRNDLPSLSWWTRPKTPGGDHLGG